MFENDGRFVARFNSGEAICADSMRTLYYAMRCFFRICGEAEGLYYAAIEIDSTLRFFVWFAEGKLEIVPCIVT